MPIQLTTTAVYTFAGDVWSSHQNALSSTRHCMRMGAVVMHPRQRIMWSVTLHAHPLMINCR
jgi:hypothetical protein